MEMRRPHINRGVMGHNKESISWEVLSRVTQGSMGSRALASHVPGRLSPGPLPVFTTAQIGYSYIYPAAVGTRIHNNPATHATIRTILQPKKYEHFQAILVCVRVMGSCLCSLHRFALFQNPQKAIALPAAPSISLFCNNK